MFCKYLSKEGQFYTRNITEIHPKFKAVGVARSVHLNQISPSKSKINLHVLRRIGKTARNTVSFVVSLCLRVCPSLCPPDGIFMKLHIREFFKNLPQNWIATNIWQAQPALHVNTTYCAFTAVSLECRTFQTTFAQTFYVQYVFFWELYFLWAHSFIQ